MKEYKVGDEVRIKSLTWYRGNADADGAASGGFVKGMATYCGRKAHIAEIDTDGHMLLDFPSQHYWWSPDMFEPEPRYKKGDAVIIKSKDWYDTNKGKDGYVQFPETSVSMNESMSEYCGKATTVRDITPRGTYKLEIDDGEYYWHDGMFEYTDVPIEYNVSEKFKEDGVTFEVVLDENNTCEGCAFDGNHQYMCQKLSCGSKKRTDKQNVMFKEVTSEAEEIKEEPVPNTPKIKTGISVIIEERLRQLKVKGYDSKHDDKHDIGQLALAAALYIDPTLAKHIIESMWPEGKEFYHPKPISSIEDRIKQLAKAGALITAEIDRLYRVQERLGDVPQKVQESIKGGFSD